jgi:hypothetical protein
MEKYVCLDTREETNGCGASYFVLFTKYHYDTAMKEHEMG